MSLFNVLDIAGSALAAQSSNLRIAAGDAVRNNAAAYHMRRPLFAAMLHELAMNSSVESAGRGGEISDIATGQALLPLAYRLRADADGRIPPTEADGIDELANLIAAARRYQISVEVAKTSMEMVLRTLSLGS